MNDFIDFIAPRYKLAICELYHPDFHGHLNNNNDVTKYVYNSYLCAYTLENDEIYDLDLYPTNNVGPWGLSTERIWPNITHPTIRNYANIVKKYKLDIVQMVYLNTGHHLCILKTFWLKIIQRKYKTYFKNLQMRINRAKHPKTLLQRQMTGKRV